jgi:CO dehydrogenase/acetyl-CoA synthase alpha subunit
MAGNNPRGRGPQKDKVVVSLDAKAVHDAIPGIVALVKAASLRPQARPTTGWHPALTPT